MKFIKLALIIILLLLVLRVSFFRIVEGRTPFSFYFCRLMTILVGIVLEVVIFEKDLGNRSVVGDVSSDSVDLVFK